MTIGLLLSLARNIHTEERAVRQGLWQTTPGTAVRGRTLAVLGLGDIGFLEDIRAFIDGTVIRPMNEPLPRQ